ncbi:MAG: LRR-like protein, partial [Cytophagales bacterium]|nr:LRR-like protein [Cytophagales bacterium]
SAPVILPKTEGCDNIFSPNGNTNRTSFYIEEQGKAQIIDIKGNIITELSTPGYWDGTRSDRSLADTGYYAIIVNNKKVGTVTLVR